MEFYFIQLLQVRSILCGMCFLIMIVIFNIFEAISQLNFFNGHKYFICPSISYIVFVFVFNISLWNLVSIIISKVVFIL
jgi:hypothetical protein